MYSISNLGFVKYDLFMLLNSFTTGFKNVYFTTNNGGISIM